MLRWKIFRSKSVAIAWFVIISILFFIPGSALPKENWLNLIYFDKWVHAGLFAILVFLWRSSFNMKFDNYNLALLFATLLYGLSVEFIQRYCVPNRTFDLYDLLADMTGSVIGLFVWLRVYKK